MKPIDKRALIQALRAQIAEEVAVAARAARDAAAAATHEEAKPENDKDTRGLEASYLARGQAARVSELELSDNALQFLPVRDFGAGDAISAGALIEVATEDARSVYFLAPAGGGMRAVVDGVEGQVVTPEAPLGQALLGHEAGESVEIRLRGARRELEILEVR